ncbi:alpha/beta fold hydrolase [Leifsonia sp. YAF41]|uniref:alpha/beta fold hydrolase n=1 Tax=Leifsonia sp. YAF41 TaxID=3233086 RepID=UPI003F9DB96E
MDHVTSTDGTRIAFDRTGNGPAIVMVVGAFCTRLTTKTLSYVLAPHYTIFEYDRRGRGDSGDAPSYAVEREYEDLAAIIAEAGGSAFVYGHSSGAALALGAAAQGVPMRKIAVYEPPFFPGQESPGAFTEEVRELLAAGDREEAALRFIVNTGAPREAAEQIRNAPFWPDMLAIAHTLPSDLTLSDLGAVDLNWTAGIREPILALFGGESADWASNAARLIAETAPDARASVVEGQAHGVSDETLAPVLRDFFV